MGKIVIITFVIIVSCSICSGSAIYQIIEGNISDSWKFNFSLRPLVLNGTLIYIIESDRNQFGLSVAVNRSEEFFCLRFRHHNEDKFHREKVSDICGNKYGKYLPINFLLELKYGIIFLICNERYSQQIIFKTAISNQEEVEQFCYNQNAWITIFPTIKSMKNRQNIFITWIGNVGPFESADGTTFNAAEEQLTGCLSYFYYDNNRVEFQNKLGDQVKTHCPRCILDTCNGGLCVGESSEGATCDCSTTALNGPKCNRALRSYVRDEKHSYEVLLNRENIEMKLSWKAKDDKIYCLMNFNDRTNHVALWINNGNLMVNSKEISNITFGGFHFLVIRMSDTILSLTITNRSHFFNHGLSKNVQLNIGFIKQIKFCETFEGNMELLFDPKVNRRKKDASNVLSSTFSYQNGNIKTKFLESVSFVKQPQFQMSLAQMSYVVIISISVMSSLILVVVLAKLFLKKSKRSKEIKELGNAYEMESADNSMRSRDEHTYAMIEYSTI